MHLFRKYQKVEEVMKETGKNKDEGKRKKYNLTQNVEKEAPYRQMINPAIVDALYERILSILIVGKKYKDPNYSAKQLAIDLETNTRYLSAVVNLRFGCNYSSLVNQYRIRDARYLLSDRRTDVRKSMDEISREIGFSNRQSFYAAFYKYVGVTPREYRLAHNQSYAVIVSEREKQRAKKKE